MPLGALIGGGISFGSQARAQHNNKIAYKHRYRWAMDDMRKAGLNPILAASQGIGGSFPSSSGFKADSPDLSKTAGSVMAYRRQNQELQNMQSEKHLTDSLWQKARADFNVSTAAVERTNEESEESRLRQLQLLFGMPAAEFQAQHAKEMGIWGPRLDRIIRALPPVAGAYIGSRLGGKGVSKNKKNFKTKKEKRAESIENSSRRQ